ncbi:cell death abnormality protein 1-like [Haliotis cracherodii]|uniref:cell death abnormality protein 1-like n=1 Tax=Haliotis cracherodii TaxID=6455 RepID=UPI0039E89A44
MVINLSSKNLNQQDIAVLAKVSTTSTPCSNCDGNNVTCVDGVCLPRCVNVSSSGECLQCLDSRFYGDHCEQDCPDTCLNSRCQMDNTRVVCTEGCVAGKKGDNCGANCPTACTQCERYGDGCTGPCRNPRYYGDKCDVTCPPNCRGGCDKDTGECDSCEPDYTGDKCDVTCPPNCRGGCDKDTGECDSCEPDYTGDKCDVTCPPNCRGGCDKDTGQCGNCEPGYTGKYCNDSCPSQCTECQQHGVNCIGQCHRWNYHGNNCTLLCPVQCRGCVKETGCDKDTGKCISCKQGLRGELCDDTCPSNCTQCERYGDICIGACPNSGYYGRDCSIQCPVSCEGCHKETGLCMECAEGFSRTYCDEICSPCSENTCYRTTCRKRKTDHTVAITTGTVAVVIVLALIIAFWRHTQKGNRTLGSGTNGTTHSEYSDSLAHRDPPQKTCNKEPFGRWPAMSKKIVFFVRDKSSERTRTDSSGCCCCGWWYCKSLVLAVVGRSISWE